MELLERFVQGEPEALETLFRQFQRPVQGWIVRLVRDPSVAEELTVETFWRAYRVRACFDPARGPEPMRTFGGWLRRIGTNLALDHLRRARPEVPLGAQDTAGAAGPEPVLDRERREAIARAFGLLPARLRAPATLALIEELPHGDIADALGISVGAVKNRVFRAVHLLRKRLERLGVTP